MRPAGEVRRALLGAAAGSGGTYRELAERAQVGYAVALRTVSNMARAGALVPAGQVHAAHARRPLTRWQTPEPDALDVDAAALDYEPLAGVLGSWRR